MFWGAKYPIILAPMGGVGTVELAAAVCNAGGVGSLAAAYLSPQEIRRQIDDLRSRTDRPFAVNLFAQGTKPLDRDPGPMLSLLGRFHEELGLAPPIISQSLPKSSRNRPRRCWRRTCQSSASRSASHDQNC